MEDKPVCLVRCSECGEPCKTGENLEGAVALADGWLLCPACNASSEIKWVELMAKNQSLQAQVERMEDVIAAFEKAAHSAIERFKYAGLPYTSLLREAIKKAQSILSPTPTREAERLRKIIDAEAPLCTCHLSMGECRHCQLEARLMKLATTPAGEWVSVRREDLEWAQSYTPAHWSDGRPNEYYNRIQVVLGFEPVGKWKPKTALGTGGKE